MGVRTWTGPRPAGQTLGGAATGLRGGCEGWGTGRQRGCPSEWREERCGQAAARGEIVRVPSPEGEGTKGLGERWWGDEREVGNLTEVDVGGGCPEKGEEGGQDVEQNPGNGGM